MTSDEPTPSAPPAKGTGVSTTALDRIPLMLRMIVYTILFLGLVLGLVPWLFSWLDVLIPAIHIDIGPARWAGAVLFFLSLTAYLVSSYVLTSKGQGPFVEFDPPKKLVIEGPYRFVRNPVVCFLLGSMLGEAIFLSSTGVLLMFVIFAVLANGQVKNIEEPLLLQRYGEDYADYCRRVPRWIPRWPSRR
jgi:protein-S-isoprenylcysteine O-methyltransferase Ste14